VPLILEENGLGVRAPRPFVYARMAIDPTSESLDTRIRPGKLHFVSTKVIDSELRKSLKIFHVDNLVDRKDSDSWKHEDRIHDKS
jgi:hypothetical protein